MTDDPLDAPMSDPTDAQALVERLDAVAESLRGMQRTWNLGEDMTQALGTAEDELESLAPDLRDLVETAEDAEHSTKVLREEIHKCHQALDVRCIDKPSKVGCEDMVFETHKVVADLVAERGRLRAEATHARSNHAAETNHADFVRAELETERDAALDALREIREIDIAFWEKRALSEMHYRDAMDDIRRAADAVLEDK